MLIGMHVCVHTHKLIHEPIYLRNRERRTLIFWPLKITIVAPTNFASELDSFEEIKAWFFTLAAHQNHLVYVMLKQAQESLRSFKHADAWVAPS